MKINKYLYGYNISVNYGYGHGWEVECFEESYKDARERLREYRENCGYPVRMRAARTPNPRHPDNV